MKRIIPALLVIIIVTPVSAVDKTEIGHLENDRLSVNLFDDGSFKVSDLRNKRNYASESSGPTKLILPGRDGAPPKVRQVGQALQLERPVGGLNATVKFEIDGDRLGVEISADPLAEMDSSILDPHPIRFDAPGGYWMVPLAAGIAYGVQGDDLRWISGEGWSPHTMPVFAGVDPAGGGGFLAVIETPFDASIREVMLDQRRRSMAVSWLPTMGRFGYARRMGYYFLPRGTLIDAAKRYRDYVKSRGMWIGFAEKAKERPQVERFMGASNVYHAHSDIYAALHQLGVRRLIPDLMQLDSLTVNAVRRLGFIISRYDIYTDVYNPKEAAEWGPGRHPSNWRYTKGFRFPDDIIKNRNGSLDNSAPGITNPKTGKIALGYRPNQRIALDVIKRDDRAAGEIKKFGLESYFIDVATAHPLMEDYDPNHTCTRAEDANWRREQFRYLRSLGVLVGSEYGRDWAMPYVDWFQGIAGPGKYGFAPPGSGEPSSGYEPLDTTATPYDEVTFSLKRRQPMFELVYHGSCRATHWWNDHPIRMPHVWYKRDLVHLLLDDMEVFSFSTPYEESFFWLNIDRVVNSCKLLAAWGQAVGYEEITDYVVLDRAGAVARASYSGGLSITVNLGEAPVLTPEGIEMPPHAYLITGKSSHMPLLPVGKPVAVAPDWEPLDGWFEIKALGHLTGWSAPSGMHLEADGKNLRPGAAPGRGRKETLASARIEGISDRSGVVLKSRAFVVLGGWTYSLGAWERGETGCQVMFALEPEGSNAAINSKPVTVEPDWTYVAWRGAVPEGATRAHLVVRVNGGPQPVQLNVDDLTVRATQMQDKSSSDRVPMK